MNIAECMSDEVNKWQNRCRNSGFCLCSVYSEKSVVFFVIELCYFVLFGGDLSEANEFNLLEGLTALIALKCL